jgi:hypothetical protein
MAAVLEIKVAPQVKVTWGPICVKTAINHGHWPLLLGSPPMINGVLGRSDTPQASSIDL